MNPFKIPTDNMYKFMAVLSFAFSVSLTIVLAYLVSIAIPIYLKTTNETWESARLVNTTQKRIDFAKENNLFLGENKINLEDDLQKYKDQNDMSNEIILIMTKTGNMIFIIYLIIFVSLQIPVYVSFKLWYLQLQKYQDVIIKNQAESIQSSQINKNEQ